MDQGTGDMNRGVHVGGGYLSCNQHESRHHRAVVTEQASTGGLSVKHLTHMSCAFKQSASPHASTLSCIPPASLSPPQLSGAPLRVTVSHLRDEVYVNSDHVKATSMELVNTMKDLLNMNPLYGEQFRTLMSLTGKHTRTASGHGSQPHMRIRQAVTYKWHLCMCCV